MKQNVWQDIYFQKRNGHKLFCHHHFSGYTAPSIIYIQTPLGSVTSFSSKSYTPLENSGFNVFALDPTGIGKSDGEPHEFSLRQLVDDIDALVTYIGNSYSNEIHLFGGTGIGGILGQYYVSQSQRIQSFAQYGVGIHNDPSPLKMPRWMAKASHAMLKKMSRYKPSLNITSSPPKYHGYNKATDDLFYEMMLKDNPDIFSVNIKVLCAILETVLDETSALKNMPSCPTLFFKQNHDRYFPGQYFDRYDMLLTCEHKMYVIDDIHNSHYFRSEEICKEVISWFRAHSNIMRR